MRAILDAAPKPGTMKCPQFSPTVIGSDMCKCGHVLYAHYMCGDPRKSACLSCGKVTPKEEPKEDVPSLDDRATLERKLRLAEMSAAASSRAVESSNHAALEIGKALGCSAVTSDIIDHIHELQRTISVLAARAAVGPTEPKP